MKIFQDEDGKASAIFFETKQEGQDFVLIMEAALKTMNKQSRAYKMAKKIEQDLPV